MEQSARDASALSYVGSDSYTADELRAVGAKPIPRPEPLARALAPAAICFDKPDLELQERFLTDFGLVSVSRDGDRLLMRGSSAEPVIYEARKADRSAFRGALFHVSTRAELETLALASGTVVRPCPLPGGGERVELIDPNGFEIGFLCGKASVSPLPARKHPYPFNTPDRKERINKAVRPPLEPTPVVRFAHMVLQTPDFDATVDWYLKHLGMIPTDVFCLSDGTPNMAFLRLDLGSEPADHHTVVVFGAPGPPKYLHSAYETLDIDAIGQGQQVMKQNGWDHHWGIGRHIFGSQIFDYWIDPWGDEVEHYADGDVFDNSAPTEYHILDRGGLWMWGHDLPPSMRPKPSIKEFLAVTYAAMTGKVDMNFVKRLQSAMTRKPRPWLK